MYACPKCLRTFEGSLAQCPDDDTFLVPEEVLSADKPLERGETVGQYVIEAKIGAGTFGVVYRAIQPLIGKQVAIKVLGKRYSVDPAVVSRFMAEARAVNQIRHRNIIDIFSFGQLPDGRHYHIMELLVGTTLDQRLKERGRIALVEMIMVLRPLARALDAAHAAGIAHRDLKPANVFIGRDDDGAPFPKLLDFGIAKLLSNDLPRQHQTGTGVAVGTPDYMSPEQCQGPNIDHRTDIYAFGVMAYQLITGQLPFVGNNVVEVLVKQMTATATPPSQVCPDLPRTIDAPIMWMLEKDKSKRPPDLATAMGALETAANASGLHVPAFTSTTGEPDMTPVMVPAMESAALADPALSQTLPSDVRTSVERIVANQEKRRTPWMYAIIACIALAFSAAAIVWDAMSSDDPPEQPQIGTNVEKPIEPPQPTKNLAPVTIEIEVHAPKGTLVKAPDGLYKAPATIHMARGDTPIALELSLPGYVAVTRTIVPDRNRVVEVELEKVSDKAADKTKKKKSVKKNQKRETGLDDIENFDN